MRCALIDVLSEEHAAKERLASLLMLEHKALTAGDPVLRIADVVRLKNDAVTRLATLEARRNGKLFDLGYPAGAKGVEAFAANDPRVADQWIRLKASSKRVSAASDRNAALATLRTPDDAGSNDSQQAEARVGLYGPDGRLGTAGRR